MTTQNRIIGDKVDIVPLASLHPNWWNQNVMPPHKYASLKHGLKTRGWLVSDTLLIWGTDETGKSRNVIIDGEHRWQAARELEHQDGPAIVLTGITEAQARAWTLRLANRGTFAAKLLDQLLAELREDYESIEAMALDLALTEPEAMRALAQKPIEIGLPEGEVVEAKPKAPDVVSHNTHTHVVPLYLDAAQRRIFDERVRLLGKQYGLETVTEIVIAAVSNAVRSSKAPNA
jgi:hypothetical protein